MRHTFLVGVLFAVGAAVTTACSSSSSSGGGSPCEQSATAYCERACGCSTDGQCRIVSSSSATVTFKSKADCLSLNVTLGCSGGGKPGMDYAKCQSAIGAAA